MLDPLGPAVEGLARQLAQRARRIGDGDRRSSAPLGRVGRIPPSSGTSCGRRFASPARSDEAEALAAPGVPPRRGVIERDVAVLRNYVALLRLREARAPCRVRSVAHDARCIAEQPLPLSTCMVAAGYGCADRAFDLIEQALDTGRGLAAGQSRRLRHGARASAAAALRRHAAASRFGNTSAFRASRRGWGSRNIGSRPRSGPIARRRRAYDFKAACAEALRG